MFTCFSSYERWFPSARACASFYTDQFASKPQDLLKPLSQRGVDFSIETRQWIDTAQKIVLFILKIVIFPWGLYEGIRWILREIVLAFVWPISTVIGRLYMRFFLGIDFNLNQLRQDLFEKVDQKELVRDVVLEQNGVRYSGVMIASETTFNNGNWVLQMHGNADCWEINGLEIARIYRQSGYNTLLINGPGVGKSEGSPTIENFADSVNVGLKFLETAVKANNIAIVGQSLGGAVVSKAVESYEFNKEINYLVGRQVTFGSLGEIVEKISGWFAKRVVQWAFGDIDLTRASHKIDCLNKCRMSLISDVIIRVTGDGVIPEQCSLQNALLRAGFKGMYRSLEYQDGTVLADGKKVENEELARDIQRSFGSNLLREGMPIKKIIAQELNLVVADDKFLLNAGDSKKILDELFGSRYRYLELVGSYSHMTLDSFSRLKPYLLFLTKTEPASRCCHDQ